MLQTVFLIDRNVQKDPPIAHFVRVGIGVMRDVLCDLRRRNKKAARSRLIALAVINLNIIASLNRLYHRQPWQGFDVVDTFKITSARLIATLIFDFKLFNLHILHLNSIIHVLDRIVNCFFLKKEVSYHQGVKNVEFYAMNGRVRPIRLSEETRRFAFESLSCKYGLDTRKTNGVTLDGVENYEQMTPIERYDAAIAQIAREAPIRICEGERVSGAATLWRAVRHGVPALYRGETAFFSVSHLTVDFETVLKRGILHIRATVEQSLEVHRGSEREPFLQSCLHCLDAFDVWHGRYLEALGGMSEYASNYKNLQRVPHKPATNFYEAVQSLWFTFAFIRLCGNWPGIGRIDYLLGDYLKKDLASGTLTLDEAREILAHFFIKGCEWIAGGNYGSGDAQHYQNILLCGVDEHGNEVTNEVTYLVLDILEELGISDFPTSVRLNQHSDERLVRRVAEVMRYGGGILAVYNEDLVIKALLRDGYELSEARKFANDGCWEVQIPGRTYFAYYPFDALQVLQKTLGDYDKDFLEKTDFEGLYEKFIVDLEAHCREKILKPRCNSFVPSCEGDGWKWKPQIPCTVVSLFEGGCIEKGLSYFEGGPVYNVNSPHIGGIADVANSLYAIQKLVYEERKITLPALLEILKRNWEGEEALRQYVLRRYVYYGNDNDEVDLLVRRILSDFSRICQSFNGACGYHFNSGVSTFGRQLEWAPHRGATAYGKHAEEILAGNCSPTPGTDTKGATAIIRSYCKTDLEGLATGAALDIKLLPSSVAGEDGLNALVALMRGFVALGGFFMQPDVADASILREAQKDPESYRTLSVRVSGWNARFVTLNEQWQEMVIAQNEHS